MRSSSITFGSLCVAAAAAAAVSTGADLKPALPWLPMHTHTEMMWTPSEQGLAKKPFFYDWIYHRLRVDSFDLIGLGELNSSSYWLGDDLYIYDFGLAKSCQHLNMGFGMMMPDWMISDAYVVPQGPVWHAHKYDATSIAYVPTVFNSKASPDGNFSYYSDANGYGYVMHAPSPAGMVVNEYYDWAAADFTGDFGTQTFALPASPTCKNATNVSGVEAIRWVRDHYPIFLPEIVAAAPREIWAKL